MPSRDRVGFAVVSVPGTGPGVVSPGRSLAANLTASRLALCGSVSGGHQVVLARALGQPKYRHGSSGRGRRRPVTNQMTTTPGNGRRSTTDPDTDSHLACGNTTQCEGI